MIISTIPFKMKTIAKVMILLFAKSARFHFLIFLTKRQMANIILWRFWECSTKYRNPLILLLKHYHYHKHRSKLKLTAFLDACTSVMSYLPLKKGSYFGFLAIFVSLVLPDAPIILHERWWVRCYACN